MKAITTLIAAAAVGAAVLTGCGEDERYADVACVDRVTQVRVDDWRCSNGSDQNFSLWYLAAGQSMFGYGQRAPYGSAVVPQGYRARTITATPPPSTSTPRTSAPSTSSSKPSTSSSKPTTAKPQTSAPKVETAKPPTKKATPKPAKPSKPK